MKRKLFPEEETVISQEEINLIKKFLKMKIYVLHYLYMSLENFTNSIYRDQIIEFCWSINNANSISALWRSILENAIAIRHENNDSPTYYHNNFELSENFPFTFEKIFYYLKENGIGPTYEELAERGTYNRNCWFLAAVYSANFGGSSGITELWNIIPKSDDLNAICTLTNTTTWHWQAKSYWMFNHLNDFIQKYHIFPTVEVMNLIEHSSQMNVWQNLLFNYDLLYEDKEAVDRLMQLLNLLFQNKIYPNTDISKLRKNPIRTLLEFDKNEPYPVENGSLIFYACEQQLSIWDFFYSLKLIL